MTGVKFDAQCLLCQMRRQVETARGYGDDERAMAFARDLMEMYLAAPEDVSSPWFTHRIDVLLHRHYDLPEDRFAEEKEISNRFVLQRMDAIRRRVSEAADPLFAGLQMAILGNYIDFSALQGEVSFEALDEMLDRAADMDPGRDSFRRLCRDLEGACDEQVIEKMDQNALRAYSNALLRSAVPRHSLSACPLAFGEVGLGERIRYVMDYRKPSFWKGAGAAGLLLLVAAGFLTNPLKEYDPNQVYPQSVLREPECIVVDVSGMDRVYEKDSPVYRKLVDTIQANWWKYTQDGAATAPDGALVAPAAPELLKTSSWRTYVELDDTIIS